MKKKEMEALVAAVHKLGEDITGIEKALQGFMDEKPEAATAKPTDKKDDAPTPVPEKTDEQKAPTAVEVRKLLAKKADKHREEVKAIINKRGAKNLSSIKDPEVLAAIMKEAEEIPDA